MIGPSDFGAARILGARAMQEDEFAFQYNGQAKGSDPVLLAAVADGMGGVPGGQTAGRIVIRTFLDVFSALQGGVADRLDKALRHANRELSLQAEQIPELKGMGTTLLAVSFTEQGLIWINVGDSVLWLFRDGRLQRLNEDHSYRTMLYEKVKQGEITVEEARQSPHKNTLMSALTGGPIPMVELHETPMRLKPGDCIIVATNGVLTLTTAGVQAALTQLQDQRPRQIASLMLSTVEQKAHPTQDNATVLVIRIR
jgi:PPM family protein phosphatase